MKEHTFIVYPNKNCVLKWNTFKDNIINVENDVIIIFFNFKSLGTP